MMKIDVDKMKATLETRLLEAAKHVVDTVKRKISRSTKGSGHLEEAITYEKTGPLEVKIIAKEPFAFVEYGTAETPPKPYLRQTLIEERGKITEILKGE